MTVERRGTLKDSRQEITLNDSRQDIKIRKLKKWTGELISRL